MAYQGFQARAFHQDFGNEPIEGAIVFTQHSLSFRGGETIIETPLNRLTAQLEGGADGRIMFRDSEDPTWTIMTLDSEVLECRSIPQIARLAEGLEATLTRRELSRRVRMVLIFFAACGLALWLGMLAMGAMVRSILARVPPDVERQFGSGLLEELKADLQFVDDTNQLAQLASLAEPLRRAFPQNQDWQFYIMKEDSPNAFALPGGHIIVTTGLLQLADRPEQVLGVVAHEVAHVTHKHGFRQAISSAGVFLVFQTFLSGRGGALSLITGGSALLVHQSFSQSYEKEADDVGWKYLVTANIDPRGMIEMFQKLKIVEAGERHGIELPKAFESHPDLDKRIARLEAKWKRLPHKSGFVELNALQFKFPEATKEKPSKP